MISTDISIWLGAFFTIAIFSYAFKDNLCFRLAEQTFVAAVVGNAAVMAVNNIITLGTARIATGQLAYVLPIILGLILFMRFSKKYFWVNRYGISVLVGISTAVILRTMPKANIADQVVAAMQPLTSLDPIVMLVGTVTSLMYFTFTFKRVHESKVFSIPMKVGRYMMMAAFGAAFGATVMSRMNFLIARLMFLLRDWLGIA